MVPAALLAAVALMAVAAPVALPIPAVQPLRPRPLTASRPALADSAGPTVRGAVPASRWGWPLNPEPAVVATFHAPPTPWSAGHRGVDLAAAVGQPVRAAGGGRVTFAGFVAGRGVVVVAHRGGLRTTYEPVVPWAPVGAAVGRGSRIGVVARMPGHCAPRTCLHWGLRRGRTYLDPLSLVERGPPVLLPLH